MSGIDGVNNNISNKAADKTKAEKFQEWAHTDYLEKDAKGNLIFENGKPKDNAEDFKMFEFIPSKFSKDLYKFSNEYILEHDKDGDGKLNWDEFQDLAEGNSLLYKAISKVDGDENVSAKEFASFIQFADWDEDTQSYDGKLGYFMTQAILDANSKTIDKIAGETRDFYEYFYKNKSDDELNN